MNGAHSKAAIAPTHSKAATKSRDSREVKLTKFSRKETLLPLRRETTEASQRRLPRCGQVPRRGARPTAWLARASRVRAQHLKLGEGPGPRRRRVRGAFQRIPRHH